MKTKKLQCPCCGTKFNPESWSRPEVKKGCCPDCGTKAKPIKP